MMRIFNLVALYAFGILQLKYFTTTALFREAKLMITPPNQQPIMVNLRKVKTYLMNQNVPMWIIQNKELRQVNFKKVLLELGHFTTYQDAETSSAAVYFHKQQEFEGTVDIRYVIRELLIPDDSPSYIDQEIMNNVPNDKTVFERIGWGHSRRSETQEIEWIFPEISFKWSGEELSTSKTKTNISCVNNRELFYIEILVMINYDFANKLLIEYRQGLASILSYLLTLFNSVDMLFSKLQVPKIRINIAGIIIGNERGSLHLSHCYKNIQKFNRIVEAIDVICVDKSIKSFLSKRNGIIPQDSFDVVIFLTRFPIFEYEYNKETKRKEVVHLAGYTMYPVAGIFESRKYSDSTHGKISIEDFAFFGSAAAIAHEIVHAFGIGHHDDAITMSDEICSEKLMKPCNHFCQHCLDWSNSTKALVKELFRSPDACIFRNKPRSLYPPGPRPMLTADEQCQCYLYETAARSQKSYWNILSTWILGYCDTQLQCQGKDGKIHNVPAPMDGTPCDERGRPRKVCWNKSCTEIKYWDERRK